MNDEYYVNSPLVRSFIDHVLQAVSAEAKPERRIELIRRSFADLLAAEGWLPGEFACPHKMGGMGGDIGSYLLYRRDDTLSLMSLVVPAGSLTPIHDHLGWGLVGLYRGEQHEEIYQPIHSPASHEVVLKLAEERRLKPGDFYSLLPPEGDIHRVRTTSPIPSISIHLLGNDIGCIWRHTFDPHANTMKDFRSGYSNVPCKE
ncbi:MAG TPA: hypothetical protein VJZ03_04775 [Candidatus Bathyarchaeia archaeon]|nr:hypothetical protein [Candidatus Bathyarchaeia archaeon]